MNLNLLNKIQAIKTLRDRAATEGEKDAAQHKLTLLLAKHKLTEQDIPDPNFSTRGRYNSPPRQRRPPGRPPSRRYPKQEFDQAQWDDLFRVFREATGQQQPPPRPQQPPQPPQPPRKVKGAKARERFENRFGVAISDVAWRTIYLDYTRAKRIAEPANPNAFTRAYMEWAAIFLKERIAGKDLLLRAKSSNLEGKTAAQDFAEHADLALFLKYP